MTFVVLIYPVEGAASTATDRWVYQGSVGCPSIWYSPGPRFGFGADWWDGVGSSFLVRDMYVQVQECRRSEQAGGVEFRPLVCWGFLL